MKKVPFNVLANHAGNAPAGIIGAPRADAGNAAQLLAEVKASVQGLRDDVMATAEKAIKEAERGGTMSAEVKAKVDELLPQFNEAKAAQARIEGQLEALEARSADVEQAIAQGVNGAVRAAPSMGRQLADSDDLGQFVGRGAQGSFTFRPQATVTTADGSGSTWSAREAEPVNLPRRRLRLRDLVTVTGTTAGVIDYLKQTTRTNGAAPVAEEAAAPTSDYGWTKAQAIVRKLAHIAHISEEALADGPRLAGFIDSEMRYGLDLVEDTQILSGDGTGQNLSGLLTDATAFSAAAGLPDGNRIERLRLAMLQVVLADYASDAVVLNPTDWAAIELTKDTQGRFIVGNADSPIGPRLWGVPVAESNAMTAGSWLVGALQMAATLYDREETEILVSTEHGTNFIDGMVTMKASKRVALEVKRGASLVTGNFTFV